jgi:putative hydroxymethylpyrimidine transport system substrate-binding protein
VAERVRLLLDWKPDAKHALFYEGLERGAYAQAGIALELVEPEHKSIQALERLSAGKAELAINYPHNLLLSGGQCPGLLSAGALVRSNPQGLLSLAARPVRTPAELSGRRVGIGPSPVSRAQFDVFCQANRLDRAGLQVVTVGFEGEELLLSGAIDALDAVAYAIARTERKGHPVYFLPYARHGIPDSPFLVFAARAAWADARVGPLREFFRVTGESFAHVSAWGDAEWAAYARAIPGRNGEEERAVWRAIRPLILGQGRLFTQDLTALEGLQRILLGRGLLDCPADLRGMFPDRFLLQDAPAPPPRAGAR